MLNAWESNILIVLCWMSDTHELNGSIASSVVQKDLQRTFLQFRCAKTGNLKKQAGHGDFGCSYYFTNLVFMDDDSHWKSSFPEAAGAKLGWHQTWNKVV